jgi:ribosome biogenesis protein MAK21
VSALLTGVHRAFPFATTDSAAMAGQLETMYKIAHLSNFNIALHAFMLLFQVIKK